MAKFTMTIGEMVTAYRKQLQITKTEALTLPDGTSWTFTRLNQMPTLQTTITDYSYPWLIHEIETLKEDYSDDSELNRSISNQLAQTFVRHFWQYEIGFETPDVFAIQLRSFFDSYMPIFIKWYQQYAINNQSYLTSVTNLTRNVNGTIHMQGTGKADGNLKDTTTTDGTTNQNGTAKTTGKTTDTETGNQTGTTKTTGKTTDTETGNQTGTTKTTGKTTDTETGNQTGTTKTTGAQNSQDKSLSGTADTPQDQLATDFGASDPVAGYTFDYASQVVGSNTTNHTTSDETQTSTSDTTASKNGTSDETQTSTSDTTASKNGTSDETQTSTSDTQANRSGTSESDTTTTDAGASHSETDRTQTTSNSTQNTNDQTSNNKEGTQTQDRTQTIMDLTNQLLNYVDGLYLDMFQRMLEYGLFMQVF